MKHLWAFGFAGIAMSVGTAGTVCSSHSPSERRAVQDLNGKLTYESCLVGKQEAGKKIRAGALVVTSFKRGGQDLSVVDVQELDQPGVTFDSRFSYSQARSTGEYFEFNQQVTHESGAKSSIERFEMNERSLGVATPDADRCLESLLYTESQLTTECSDEGDCASRLEIRAYSAKDDRATRQPLWTFRGARVKHKRGERPLDVRIVDPAAGGTSVTR